MNRFECSSMLPPIQKAIPKTTIATAVPFLIMVESRNAKLPIKKMGNMTWDAILITGIYARMAALSILRYTGFPYQGLSYSKPALYSPAEFGGPPAPDLIKACLLKYFINRPPSLLGSVLF